LPHPFLKCPQVTKKPLVSNKNNQTLFNSNISKLQKKDFMKQNIYYLAVCVSILSFAACSKSNSGPGVTTPKVANVTTIAGNGTQGYTDGNGTAAQFDHPYGVAVDASGNLFVSDENEGVIRKISPSGDVTSLAGSAYAFGHADGTGTAATFFGPDGIALDASGNLFVSDNTNNSIRKVTPAGVVTTFAGGTQGSADGTGTAAQFRGPRGIAIDGSGNLYVADTYNNRIRKITSAGVATTLAGGATGAGNGAYADGTGSAASFNSPAGVAVDGSGNVYVADLQNSMIRKITPAGVVSTIAGGTDGEADGSGSAAEFGGPQGIAVDASGTIWVTDVLGTIRRVTPAGSVTTVAGSGGGFVDGIGTAAKFSGPTGIAVDAAGNLYVADYGNGAIRKIIFK
jgi:serine/threonine protein kinase, bacterial